MQSTLFCTYPEIPRIEHLITYSYGLHLEEVACVAGAVLFQAGKKVFQVINGSQQPTNPIIPVDDVRSATWLRKPDQSEKTT